MTFTVIIPTLQRVRGTAALVRDLSASPLVSEILVINNAPKPLPYYAPKVREIHRPTNIFVNPSWNLGVEQARHDLVCLANDDIRFDTSMFRVAARLLRLPIGILAPHEASFVDELPPDMRPLPRRRLRLQPSYRRTNGFGTLMFMRRDSFVPVPDALQVWFGDDFLFHQQTRRNVVFSGLPIHTRMSSTSGSPEFVQMGEAETAAYLEIGFGDYEHRFRRDLQVLRPLRRVARSLQGHLKVQR